jgi:hypothetical protein
MMELVTFFALAAEPRSCAVAVPAVSPRSQQSYGGTLLGAPGSFFTLSETILVRSRRKLHEVRAGAWLISPYTGWKWAKLSGDVGWLPSDVKLPASLRVPARNDIQ